MNTETKHDMFAILADLEDNQVEIDRVRKLLLIYDEQLSEEIRIFDRTEKKIAEHIRGRFDLIQAALDAAIIQLYETESTMKEKLQRGFALCAKESVEKTA